MNIDWILGILGIVGGLFTAAGDMLLDIKGPNNKKVGKLGIMDSAWERMDARRFPASILLAMLGVPLIFLGMTAMARQLMAGNELYGKIFWYISMVGCCGAFFIHVTVCLFPIIYKIMAPDHEFAAIEKVVNGVYRAVQIPFWLLYALLLVVPSFMVIGGLFAGYLQLSPWFTLLTGPCLVIYGIILNKIKYNWFCDLPFIIMPSLGMSMFGLLAVLNILA